MIKHKLLQTKKRGFTIVELLVVIAVIGILVTVGVFAYINVKKQSADNAISSNVSWLENRLAKYKDKTGEYPLMEQLNPGTSATMNGMTDFTAAATLLDVKPEFLSGPNNLKFYSRCASGCVANPATNQYTYVGLNAATNVGGGQYTWSMTAMNCTVVVPYNTPSYVFVYYNTFKSLWIFKTNPGSAATVANYSSGPTAPQTCTFTK